MSLIHSILSYYFYYSSASFTNEACSLLISNICGDGFHTSSPNSYFYLALVLKFFHLASKFSTIFNTASFSAFSLAKPVGLLFISRIISPLFSAKKIATLRNSATEHSYYYGSSSCYSICFIFFSSKKQQGESAAPINII